MKKLILAALAALAFLAQSAHAQTSALACEPEWGALLQELGGDKLRVYVATTAQQDPHHIQAKPSLLAAVRNAGMVVCTGAELEVGWLPILLRQSGNPAIQPGQPGYFEAAAYVRMLDVPSRLDRADGDVHPGGNPHIQTDPRNIALVATALSRRLAQVDPANATYYQTRGADFDKRWQAALKRWEAAAAPLRGSAVVVHHKAFSYLENWLGLREIAQLEPKPGVEPTSSHLAEVLATLKRDPARMILRNPYNDERPSVWLAERSGLPAVMLPGTVGGDPQAGNLFALFDDTVDKLLKAAK
jgi:zinc/manganese transport system substrate-binding protein